jgi:hypothetical protein
MVRRMKPRGAPELVYGRDGRPLTVPIEAEIEDLREAVGAPVRIGSIRSMTTVQVDSALTS